MAPPVGSLPHPVNTSPSHSQGTTSDPALANGNIVGSLQAGSARPRGDSPNRSPTRSPRSPRSASVSLQAAATMNAGLQHESSRRSSSSSVARNQQSPQVGRRRSTVLMNLHLNDPSVPGPGEMVSESQSATRNDSPHSLSGSPLLLSKEPSHHRAQSLGELHQELEAEQEGHVNRLLNMIRHEQIQLQHIHQAGHGPASHSEDTSAISERSVQGTPLATPTSFSSSAANLGSGSGPGSHHYPHPHQYPPHPRSPGHPRSSFDMARAELQRRSRTPSRGPSPRLRATSISTEGGDQWMLGARDESAFYQAETQTLVRENQMLRLRIRELERQLGDIVSPNSPSTHEPSQHSNLSQAQTTSGEGSATERDAALTQALTT